MHAALIALGAHLRHPLALRPLGIRADLERRDAELRLVGDEFVHADDHATMLLDLPLLARRRLGDLALEPAGLESGTTPPTRLDLLEQRFGFALELVGERFDVVRAAERIDDVRHARLVGEHLLRAQRDLHRFFRRQRERLVHRVRVQRLRAAEHRGERLIRDAHDVVHRLLRGERDAGGLRVEAHDPRARLFAP